MASSDPWFSWDYIENNRSDILNAFNAHWTLTLEAIVIAALIAIPLGIIAVRYPKASRPILGVSSALYTVPSLALFAILAPFTGIGRLTVLIGLVMYALLVIVRNTIVGMNDVPQEAVFAARGMGMSEGQLLRKVRLPLALPAIMTGLRTATVSTIALVTVGVVVGYGGLGQLMFRGFQSGYRAEITTSIILCVLLALLADVLIALLSRSLTPWNRRTQSKVAAA